MHKKNLQRLLLKLGSYTKSTSAFVPKQSQDYYENATIAVHVRCELPNESRTDFLKRSLCRWGEPIEENQAIATSQTSLATAWSIHECDCIWPIQEKMHCPLHQKKSNTDIGRTSDSFEVWDTLLQTFQSHMQNKFDKNDSFLENGLSFLFPRESFHKQFHTLFGAMQSAVSLRLRLNAIRSFPFEALPPSLESLDMRGCLFQGNVQWEKLPKNLCYFDITNNDFSGRVDIRYIPSRICQDGFRIENNRFSSARHWDYVADTCLSLYTPVSKEFLESSAWHRPNED